MSESENDYCRLIEPSLALLSSTDSYVYEDEIAEALIDSLNFSTQELERMLPSGRQTIFENQLQWVLSYLEQARLIESDGAKSYRVTSVGKTKDPNFV